MVSLRSLRLKSVDKHNGKDSDDVPRDQCEIVTSRDQGSERSESRTGLWFWEE
jgi:hypothetical protein